MAPSSLDSTLNANTSGPTEHPWGAITGHPTAMWTAQQIIEAFPDDRAPR
jgi:hypothetical protein